MGSVVFSATLPLATDKLETPFHLLHRDYKHRIFCILDADFTILSLLHPFKCKAQHLHCPEYMIFSPLKCQIIPQSQEYKHVTQPWTFPLDSSNLHVYPNISGLCQQTKSKSSQLPSTSPKAFTKAPSVPKMAEHLLNLPWILSSYLQTSTWSIAPVAGAKEQVSAWGTPAPYSPLEQDIFRPVMSAPRPVTQLMQEGWAVQHKPLNCQEIALLVHPVVPRWDQAVAGGAKARVQERWCTGSVSCLCFCSSPCLTLISISSGTAGSWVFVRQIAHMAHSWMTSNTSPKHLQELLCHSWLLLYRPRWAAQGLSTGVWRRSIFKETSTSHFYCFCPLFVWCQRVRNAKIEIQKLYL